MTSSTALQDPLGQSDAFVEFQRRLARAAKVDRPVLIIGERGTGKEMAAARLHYLSKRWEEPLVTLNCSALSPTLIESELFGYEEGAFTGAMGRRAGRFETADGGSLFLDEIGSIPIEAQEKILRVVEYGSFERVGASQPTQVDVRIVGATNVDLRQHAAEGRFKEDLLDRLSFEVLFLPPLRERREDIPILASHFAARMAFELGQSQLPEFSLRAMESLEQYPWPGNVRELKNVVERATYRADSEIITEIVFDPFDSPYNPTVRSQETPAPVPVSFANEPELKPLRSAINDLEIEYVQRALTDSKFNQRKAAELLGLTYHQFRGLYRKHAQAFKDVPRPQNT